MRQRIKVPYDPDGHLISDVSIYKVTTSNGDIEWRDACPKTMLIEYIDYYRGGSATQFIWIDEHGAKFNMFVCDFHAILMKHGIAPIPMMLNMIPVRRGRGYGMREATKADYDFWDISMDDDSDGDVDVD